MLSKIITETFWGGNKYRDHVIILYFTDDKKMWLIAASIKNKNAISCVPFIL